MKQDTPAIALADLRTIDQLVEAHKSILTHNAVRWHLRDREHNGLAPAVVRLGRNLLISQARFEQWLETRAGMAPPQHGRSGSPQHAA